MNVRHLTILTSLVAVIVGCSESTEQKSEAMFQKISSESSGITFVNNVENTADFNIFSYRNFYNGAGVGIGDINNDGLSDVYFTNNMGTNKLYLNKGNFQFEDISTTAGVEGTKAWSTGVVMADVNADGLLDIYVCNAGYLPNDDRQNELFINNGDLTFTEKAAEYNLNEDGYTTHAAFFDYDLDGDLDAYILNNSFIPANTLNYENKRELYANDWDVKDFLKGGGDKLLRNDNGKYVDVTKASGIYGSLIGFGLGITVGDINGDRLPDMYISNDFFERDYLYVNNGDGTFKETLEDHMQHVSLQSMGADMADINNDGYPEVFVTEMLPDNDFRVKTTTQFEDYKIYDLKLNRNFYHQYMQNTLQLNNQDNTFSEIAHFSGVAASDWSWGALMFDADNDSYKDIYVCNGIYKDLTDQDFINFFANDVIQKMALNGTKKEITDIISKMPSVPQVNKMYLNNKDLTFTDQAVTWGMGEPSFSNGAAYGDLDNDGDLDLIVNNVNQEAFVFRNNSNQLLKNHYLKVSLKGNGANTHAVGANVTAWCKGENINMELIPSRGFQSCIDYNVVLGLGRHETIDSLIVLWPDRSKTILPALKSDTTLALDYAHVQHLAFTGGNRKEEATTFSHVVDNSFAAHIEDKFIDFYDEGLVIKMLSREGPRAAVGDVNGDEKQDVFIGGASGQDGALYLQTGSGFVKSPNKFKNDRVVEDVAVVFFDADGDRDLDLITGSGGNHRPRTTPAMQAHLFINNGKGKFSEAPELPKTGFNTSVILPFDYDHDDDQDLFIGSRSVPGIYGLAPRSYIFENDGRGSFRDVTAEAAPQIDKLGLITDAKFADITGDGKKDLLIAGEWMSTQIFEIKDKKIVKTISNLDEHSGWYCAMAVEDLDNDGDLDLVLGNRGENFYFDAAKDAPAKLWVNDFDNNGMYEKIITRTLNGKDMPIQNKFELIQQTPSLKKKNLKHVDYATRGIQELYPTDVIGKSTLWKVNDFSTSVALNDGKGNFTFKALPREAQFSCVSAILVKDVDHDGKKDLLLAGNFTGFTPQFSKLDAGYGTTLLNKGNGDFEFLPGKKSGFHLRGDVKQLSEIVVGDDAVVLATINNQKPVLFAFKKR